MGVCLYYFVANTCTLLERARDHFHSDQSIIRDVGTQHKHHYNMIIQIIQITFVKI
jgi:hypothetical protein